MRDIDKQRLKTLSAAILILVQLFILSCCTRYELQDIPQNQSEQSDLIQHAAKTDSVQTGITPEPHISTGSIGPHANTYDDPPDSVYVAVDGHDATADGSLGAPYGSINTALAAAEPGDTIVLRSGVYCEGINVRIRMPNITIKSAKGEWAVIDLREYDKDANEDSGVYFDVDSTGSRLVAVEVIGGFYAVALETKWDWGDPADRGGASNIIIEDCILHDSRYDVVKIKPNCNDVIIRYNEIYNSGMAFIGNPPTGEDNAEGIDNVNGDRMHVYGNYIHDICSNAIYAKGGATDVVIEDNRIEVAYGAGIMVGFDTSPEFFDMSVNSEYYENIGGIIRNNLIIDTGWEGIGLYASRDAEIYSNTLVNVANMNRYHSALYFGLSYQDWEDYAGRPSNTNCRIHHNIIIQPTSYSLAMIEIRYSHELGGLSALAGELSMECNCYYIEKGSAFFTDNRSDSTAERMTLDEWQTHIRSEDGSLEINPNLNSEFLSEQPQCQGMGISHPLTFN